MNILIFSWRGPGHPQEGGAEIVTMEHASSWAKRGHEVWLFTSYFKGASKHEIINGVKIIRRGGDVFDVQIRAFFWYLFDSHLDFDLVIDEFHGIPFFTPLYIRRKKLAWIHEVAKEVWWLNPWPKPFNLIPGIVGSNFEYFVYKLLYSRIPFMTVSESTKEDLIEMSIPGDNITVINNGVNVLAAKAPKEKKNTLIYLGAISKDKGVEDAVKVFDLVNLKDKNFQFWIVGKGDSKYVSELKKVVGEFGISDKVKFWGFVDEQKKFELLSRSHILVNPSIREGWGLVNLEANSVHIPVLGYKVPGMRDSVVDGVTGILVAKKDYRALAKSALDLLANNKKYAKLKDGAFDWSKKFTWSESTKKSLKLITSI